MLRWGPFGVFLHFLFKFKLFDDFFPFQNVIANLCVSVASSLCVYVHPLNIDVPQAIIGTFFQCLFEKMVGLVAFEALCWSLNRLKCDGQCLFLSFCDSCSACEKSFLTKECPECPEECAHCGSPRHNMSIHFYRVFSHDVTAAILVSQNNETVAIWVSQTNPVGVWLFSYANSFFSSNKFA